MKINVRKCNAEHRYWGDLSFDTEGDPSLIDIPYVSFAAPIHWELHYEIFEDDRVEVTGRVCFTLKGLCSRCLKETRQEFSGECMGYYSPRHGEEDYEYRGGVVDLDEYMRDAVLDALPAVLECSEDCSPPDYQKE